MMIRRLGFRASVVAIGLALTIWGAGVQQARADMTPEVKALVEAAMATGTDEAKLATLKTLVQAHPVYAAEIALAAAVMAEDKNPELANAIAAMIAATVDDSVRKEVARAICTSLAQAIPERAFELCATVLTAVPGAYDLDPLVQTALNGLPHKGFFWDPEWTRENQGNPNIVLGDFFYKHSGFSFTSNSNGGRTMSNDYEVN